MTLGGSLFIRNGIKYDYCYKEALASLVDVCDEIVVLDCQSDDGTTEELREFVKQNPKIRLVEGGIWECAENWARLALLANQAINQLNTDWHFMIQGDEVLHEKSHAWIRVAIETASPETRAFHCRRIHLFGNPDHYLRHDLEMNRKPSSDVVIRLARRGIMASGDAESLDPQNNCSHSQIENIVLLHYGFVRKNSINITKAIDMQNWFHGKNSTPDVRLLELQKDGNVWHPEKWFNWQELASLYISHPKFSERWVEERRKEHPECPGCFSHKK
jgi:glycosyltransferase involved in cell wall biosynthesis